MHLLCNDAIIAKGETHPAAVNTISVSSLENVVKKIKATRGEILGPKITVPTVGHMTYFKDTESNIFRIMQIDPKAK